MTVQQSVNVTQVRYFKQTLLMAAVSEETLAVGVSLHIVTCQPIVGLRNRGYATRF
jgi:hypothetical protein